MKKILISLCVILLFCLVGCGEESSDRVSYRQNAYLSGEIDNFSVTVISGLRESPYIADGEKGELVEFCIISLSPKNSEDINKTYSYKVEIDGEIFQGNLNKETFGSTLSRDLGVDVGANMSSITFSDGESEFTVPVENMTANALVSGDDALNTAKAQFKDIIDKEESEEKYREIYIKFVSDRLSGEKEYYWYVAFVGKDNDYLAVLIDVVSGDVIAKRGG